MVSHLPIPFSHHPSRITLGFAMRGDGRVIGHNQLRDPLNKFERTHMRADPGVHTHIRERATIHVTRIWQHRNEQIRLSNLTSHRINELNRVPGPIHEHGPAWLMMQRGNQIMGGRIPAKQVTILRIPVLAQLRSGIDIGSPCLQQREMPVRPIREDHNPNPVLPHTRDTATNKPDQRYQIKLFANEANINTIVDRAQKVADGGAAFARTRSVKVSGADKQLDQARIDRARQLAGLTGYVTNLPTEAMSGSAVIGAYHDLWEVGASFRLTKSDLAARPVFHRKHGAIEAHLTVVFAPLAITRHLQRQTRTSIKKIVQTLRPVQSACIEINSQEIDIEPKIPNDAQALINTLSGH